jgi:hypothetical protein
VYDKYNVPQAKRNIANGEVDHLYPLCAGGSGIKMLMRVEFRPCTRGVIEVTAKADSNGSVAGDSAAIPDGEPIARILAGERELLCVTF